MANRNITLSVPEQTLRAAKILAAKRDTSVSALLRKALDELVREESGYEIARREFMAVVDQGFDLGTMGKASWTRDELHER